MNTENQDKKSLADEAVERAQAINACYDALASNHKGDLEMKPVLLGIAERIVSDIRAAD
jgi:hypothetical protein